MSTLKKKKPKIPSKKTSNKNRRKTDKQKTTKVKNKKNKRKASKEVSIERKRKSKNAIKNKAKKVEKNASASIRNRDVHLTTGSSSLDKLLGKGIIQGTSVLILGVPHSGKKPIIMKMVKENCSDNLVPIVVLTELGVNNWISMAKINNWYCKKKQCKIIYIDGYSQQFNTCPLQSDVKCLQVPFTLSSLSIAISDEIKRVKEQKKIPIVIFHSISSLVETFGMNEVYSFLQFFLGKLSAERITIVSTMQMGVHGENFETSVSGLHHCVIKLKDNQLNASGYITIKDNKWHNYKFVKNTLTLID